MQTINVRALIFKRDLVAVNMSVTGIMLVKLFGDLIFETWAPGQIASESMTSFFCWSVLISSFNHNSSNTMPILTNTYTLTQSFAECKTRLIKKLQPGDEKNFKCTFRLQSQVRWNYSHRFDAWSYNLCGIYFRSCIRPHDHTAAHVFVHQDKLVEKPTPSQLKSVLENSALAPASDPVFEVWCYMTCWSRVTGVHTSNTLQAPIYIRPVFSKILCRVKSSWLPYLPPVLGNDDSVSLCEFLDWVLSLRSFFGLAEQPVSRGNVWYALNCCPGRVYFLNRYRNLVNIVAWRFTSMQRNFWSRWAYNYWLSPCASHSNAIIACTRTNLWTRWSLIPSANFRYLPPNSTKQMIATSSLQEHCYWHVIS